MPRNSDGLILSHWHTLFEDFSTSTQDFYRAVEDAIYRRYPPGIEISRVLFHEGGIASAQREYLRVQRKRVAFDICSAPYGNGHFFSWWLARIPPRFGAFATIGIFFLSLFLLYMLQIIVSPMLPHGFIIGRLLRVMLPFFLYPMLLLVMGYFVQQGILADEEWVMSLPIIGRLYVFVFNPLTYYRLDTAYMFRDSVRAAVNEIINDLREQKGLRLLGDEELRPDADEEKATA
jgi:hypothetical protein